MDPATGARSSASTAEVGGVAVGPSPISMYRPFPDRPSASATCSASVCAAGSADLGTIVVMGVLGGLLALVVPIATGLLFNRFIPGSDRGGVAQVAVAMVRQRRSRSRRSS